MKLKFHIDDELISKFGVCMFDDLDGQELSNIDIEELPEQYKFVFTAAPTGDWHFELNKNPDADGLYKLCCSTMEVNVHKIIIKDLKLFCAQIAKLKDMQTQYVNF
jgi:hypothetical protein